MSLEILHSVDQVMTALGGNQPVASLTASKPSTVSMWRKAKSFPSNTHFIMSQALRDIGMTAPAELWGMKVPTPPTSPEIADSDREEMHS